MPKNPSLLSDTAIQQINSLGGPPLPLGVSPQKLRVIMENVSASQVSLSNLRIATALSARHR
jgi:hypothetical protein